MSKPNILIGTSGWNYQDWNELFYPSNVKNKEQLHFYSENFNTVEINSTVYRLPSEKHLKLGLLKFQESLFFL